MQLVSEVSDTEFIPVSGYRCSDIVNVYIPRECAACATDVLHICATTMTNDNRASIVISRYYTILTETPTDSDEIRSHNHGLSVCSSGRVCVCVCVCVWLSQLLLLLLRTERRSQVLSSPSSVTADFSSLQYTSSHQSCLLSHYISCEA